MDGDRRRRAAQCLPADRRASYRGIQPALLKPSTDAFPDARPFAPALPAFFRSLARLLLSVFSSLIVADPLLALWYICTNITSSRNHLSFPLPLTCFTFSGFCVI